MARLHLPQLLLLLLALVAIASASAPTFCKCTCFKNSTIIPLGPEHQLRRRSLPVDLPSENPRHHAPRSISTSCSECTKAFCLSQGIDFCKDAKEEDVTTLCFKRDSNKDRIIVWGFIFGTTGLLGWAAFKRIVEYRDARALGQQGAMYTAMGRR
ncbi:hypothetical protein ESCO_005614 [Escovopsis weberi]|uniref:MFS transporter n=1 Tax=Escovopsis weberi TaxID=150374 RepID=A0A0M8MUU7_ESCWE|nr:hypothetical protein ESCO_005614 [Escovopsis weberi]